VACLENGRKLTIISAYTYRGYAPANQVLTNKSFRRIIVVVCQLDLFTHEAKNPQHNLINITHGSYSGRLLDILKWFVCQLGRLTYES
jgi:hypothetical protein